MAEFDRSVLVLGAQGVLGSVSARAFQREGWRVVRAGRRPETDVSLVDLDRPETLRETLDGIDVVVPPVPTERLAAERVVLESGPALVNLSTSPASAWRPIRREATAGRGLVLMHAGVAPGVTGLLAADLLRLHPDADEVEVAFTISAGATSG
jgi:saccharopine dehydrogenase-like NADP-dependent oxidoreductase